MIRVQSSKPLHAKTNPTSYLFGSRFACAQTAIFSAEPCSKNAGETQLFLGLWLVSKEIRHPAIQTKIELHFGGFFHQRNLRQPIIRQDSMQTDDWNREFMNDVSRSHPDILKIPSELFYEGELLPCGPKSKVNRYVLLPFTFFRMKEEQAGQ